jgi:hypothetical protein
MERPAGKKIAKMGKVGDGSPGRFQNKPVHEGTPRKIVTSRQLLKILRGTNPSFERLSPGVKHESDAEIEPYECARGTDRILSRGVNERVEAIVRHSATMFLLERNAFGFRTNQR